MTGAKQITPEPGLPPDYLEWIKKSTTWLEQLGDKFTTVDQRVDYVVKHLAKANAVIGDINAGIKDLLLKEEEKAKRAPPLFPGLPKYNVLRFKLDTARPATGEEIDMPGDSITAFTDGTLDGIYIRLNSPTSDAIPLNEFNPYRLSSAWEKFWLETTAQPGKYLILHIGREGSAEASLGLMPVSLDIANLTGNIPISLDIGDLVGNIPISLDVANIIGNIPIDIIAQTVGNLRIDLVAQTVGNLDIDIAAQTVGNLNVNIAASDVTMLVSGSVSIVGTPSVIISGTPSVTISSGEVTILGTTQVDIATQTVGNLKVDLVAQTVGKLNVALVASTAVLDFNIAAQAVTLSINFADQVKGILSQADWATKDAADIHLQGATASLAAGATATLITLTLTTLMEHWLYNAHISGTKDGLGKVRANKTGGYDELAGGYFPNSDGYIKTWTAPVKRREDVAAGITEITVEVTNVGSSGAGAFIATLDGLKVVDVGVVEQIYTSQAEWQACATQTDVDLTTSAGDVLPAVIV